MKLQPTNPQMVLWVGAFIIAGFVFTLNYLGDGFYIPLYLGLFGTLHLIGRKWLGKYKMVSIK